MHTIPPGLHAFDVNEPIPLCGRWKDSMPKTRDRTSYRLYIEARKLWRSKVEWQLTRHELLRILHDVQAAANQGDWGARALLAYFYRSGLGPIESNHVLDPDAGRMVEIIRSAVVAGQAWGHYDLGVAYENGYGAVPQDDAIAWAYYLRAAELGSPEAQMVLASAYQKAERRDAEQAMIQCAYKQGHGPAAYDLAITAKLYKDFETALAYYQAGARFGSTESAAALMIIFGDVAWKSREKNDREALKRIEATPDPERERRYEQISKALDLNPDLRLPHLDKILPLPPAQLPTWHGIEAAIEPELDGAPTY